MKTYQLSIKQKTQQRGKKGTRWKDPNSSKLRIFQKRVIARGTRRNQVIGPSPPHPPPPPPIVISILDKERGGTLE